MAVLGVVLACAEKPWAGPGARHLAKGRALRFEEIVDIQLWWAGLSVFIGLGLMLALSGWWMKAARVGLPEPGIGLAAPLRNAKPWTRPHSWALAGILLLGLAFRLPRMDRFMERDEQDTVRRSMIGYVPLDREGKPEGPPVVHPWSMTVWECAQSNNPFLFSIAARVTARTWQFLSGAPPWSVSLRALRLPSLIAGLLGLAALVRLGKMSGDPHLGLVAGLLAAVHPMHVEYSTQARGYGMVLLFVPLAMAAIWQGLRTGRWSAWWAGAAALLGLLSANPGSIYAAVCLGVFLTIFILAKWRSHPETAPLSLARWFIASGTAGLIYLPLILPALPQAIAFLKTMKGSLDGLWVLMTWSQYGAGICYPPMEITQPWAQSGKDAMDFLRQGYFSTEPVLAIFLAIAIPWALWRGIRWWRGQSGFGPLLAASIAAPLAAWLMHRGPDTPFLFHWYLIYSLPPLLLLIAAALREAGGKCATITNRPWTAALPVLLYLTVFLAINRPGPGRIFWWGHQSTGAEIYNRGKYEWTTLTNGITYRKLLPGKSEKKSSDH
ncbi:MAG: hypothetical protein JWL81_860 [Verrucomicrobiales bacterium]|nr:hypothetical protein [Verrucomicrobiales bacterium]